MTMKIIIDLDTIDQTTINAIYTYSDLKEKIRDGEAQLIKWKNEFNLLMSNNFKYFEEEAVIAKEENTHFSSSFLDITSLKGLTTWIKYNREDSGIESSDSEELRRIMKRMYNAAYNPSGIAHVIRCNFNVQKFLISDMILTINKIYNIITLNEYYNEYYKDEYDPFVKFFFSNIYEIIGAVEKTSETVEKK